MRCLLVTMKIVIVCIVVILTRGLFAALLLAEAQQAKIAPRIGVLLSGCPPSVPDWKKRWVFLQELGNLGWIEGENIVVLYRWVCGERHRSADFAAELVRQNVDVIVVFSTPLIRVAQQVTASIPIVMISIGDAVAEGFIAGLAWPGGNVTGVDSSFVLELGGKLLELLKEAVPTVTRVAILANPTNPATEHMVRRVEMVARAFGMQPHVLKVRDVSEFEPALDTATREGAGALVVLPSFLFSLHQRQLAALAVKKRLPAIYWHRSFAQADGLMAYGPKVSDLLRRAAYYVDRILKGAKPAELPIERPTTFELVINLKTAKALGLTIPPTLLFQADKVIK